MSNLLRERIAVDTLLSLSAEQRERLGNYLHSPYFKIRLETGRFYQLLLARTIPDPGDTSNEEFFKEVFPGEAFDNKRLNVQFFQLMEAVMDFFAQEEFRRGNLRRQVGALDEMQTWRLDGLYTKKHKKVAKSLGVAELNSEEKIHLKLKYLRGLLTFYLREGEEKKVMDTMVHAHRVQQGLCYLVSLKLQASMLNRELLSTDKIPGDIQPPEPPVSGLEDLPLILMFEHVLEMWKAVQDQKIEAAFNSYNSLKHLLNTQEKELDASEAEDLYVYAYNFCSHFDGHAHAMPDFNPEAEMYHWFSQVMVISLKIGRLDWRYVYNHVNLLLRMEKIKEVNELLKKVEGKFVSDPQNNSLNFIKGMIAYQESDFKNARRFFLKILGENRLTLVNIHGRTMLLRCYFELGDSDLEANSESFRLYLWRSGGKSSGLSPAKLATFKNFNRLVPQLARGIAIPDDKRRRKTLERLEKKIQKSNTVAKEWMLRVIANKLSI